MNPGENQPESEPSDFGLETEPAQTGGRYRFRIAEYCQRFGPPGKPLDRKTVERWIRRGRESENGPDYPPLDAPEQMAEWWRRCMAIRVPEVFLSFENGGERGAAVPKGGEKEVEPGEADAARANFERAKKAASSAGLGFEASLERVRHAERLAFFQWQTVQIEPEKYSSSVIDRRQKIWEQAHAVLLRSEAAAEKVLARSSEWARWEDVERETGERLGVVNSAVRSLVTRIATKISLPPGLFDPLNRVFNSELDAMFRNLASSGFAPALELSSE